MKTRTGYLLKRGRMYYAAWTIGGRKFMKSTHKADRREAKAELARIMEPFRVADEVRTLENVKARIEGAKTELAVLDERTNPPVTLRHAWAAYVAATNRPDTGPATLAKQQGKFSRFLAWIERHHADAKAMRDVTETMAEAYATDLSQSGMAAATFNAHVGLLRLVWRVLGKKARTGQNPWADIGRKRIGAGGRRELTVAELRAVCGKATGDMRLLFALGCYSGLRLGDCATLRWGEVDLDRRIIRRIPLKTARRHPQPILIPLHPLLAGMLAAIPSQRRGDYVFPSIAAMYLRDGSALCKRIQEHFAACGVRTTKPGTGFTVEVGSDGKPHKVHTGNRGVVEVGFHSLRHTFVSLCREANAPLAVVEAIVGHSSPAMTRHYTHISEAAADAAVATLPSVLADKSRPTLPAPKMVEAVRIRAVVNRLTAKTWKSVKADLVALVS